MPQVLITDSLFIQAEHEAKIRAAGYEVVRLDKSEATEAELVEAIKGKTGYIIGGIEKVNDSVLNAAEELKALVFTGTSWRGFIPGHATATKRNIAIGAAPHLNAYAVAEYGLAMTLVQCRDMFALARGGSKIFETTPSLIDLSVGIVGLGHIGEAYARMIAGLGSMNVHYYSRTRKPELEHELTIKNMTKNRLLKSCDVIFVALPIEAGNDFFTAAEVRSIKSGALLISISNPSLFNLDALYKRLKQGEIRAAFDENIKEQRFQKLPLDVWYTPNESTAYNTFGTIHKISDCCTDTLLNLLASGDDHNLMNPGYKS